MKRTLPFLAATTMALVVVSGAADAAWYKKAWRGLKKGATAVVTAPFRLAGTAVAPGVKAAFDPALDGAFDRAQRLTDHATDKFRGVLDEQTNKLDKISKDRLTQFDTIMKGSISDVDIMLDDKLSDFNTIATGLLDRQAEIIDHSLTRVDLILDKNVTRVEDIADRSITRLEALQEDTFDRVNATLQDQVPFAASKTARELIPPILIVSGAGVLLGFVGYQMRRGVRWTAPKAEAAALETSSSEGESPTTTAADSNPLPAEDGSPSNTGMMNLGRLPRPRYLLGQFGVATVAVVVVGCAAWGLAEAHFWNANRVRSNRLAGAAKDFEKIGDFRSAWSIYRRADILHQTTHSKFLVDRTRFIADFAQPTLLTDGMDFLKRFGVLASTYPSQVAKDGELEAARIYLSASLGALDENGSDVDWQVQVDKYSKQFLGKDEENPRLGKLVKVTGLRLALGKQDETVGARLKVAQDLAQSIIDEYPNYAAAKVAYVNIVAIRRESENMARSPGVTSDEQRKAEADAKTADDLAKEYVKQIAAQDPSLFAMMKFQLAELDTDVASALASPGLDFGSLTVPSDESPEQRAAREEKASLARPVAEKVDAFAEELMQEAVRIFSHPAFARAETERVVARAIRRDVGLVELDKLVRAGRQGLSTTDGAAVPVYRASIEVVKKAIEIDHLAVAETWLKVAEDAKGSAATDAAVQQTEIDTLRKGIRERPINKAYPILF